jgi:hypothetical protein
LIYFRGQRTKVLLVCSNNKKWGSIGRLQNGEDNNDIHTDCQEANNAQNSSAHPLRESIIKSRTYYYGKRGYDNIKISAQKKTKIFNVDINIDPQTPQYRK